MLVPHKDGSLLIACMVTDLLAMEMEKQMIRAKCKSVPCHVFVHDSGLMLRYVSRASQVIPHPGETLCKTQQLFPNDNATVPLYSICSSCPCPHVAAI